VSNRTLLHAVPVRSLSVNVLSNTRTVVALQLEWPSAYRQADNSTCPAVVPASDTEHFHRCRPAITSEARFGERVISCPDSRTKFKPISSHSMGLPREGDSAYYLNVTCFKGDVMRNQRRERKHDGRGNQNAPASRLSSRRKWERGLSVLKRSRQPNKCAWCGGKMGMIVYRHQRLRFCSDWRGKGCRQAWFQRRFIEINSRWSGRTQSSFSCATQ
jgi:hypothetical protein